MSSKQSKTLKETEGEYKRPEKTYTEQLTEDEIKQKLVDYEKVDSPDYIKKGVHIRYFIPCKDDPKKLKFCVGGFIKSKHDDYFVFAQNTFGTGKTWSVQKKGAVFYRKIPRVTLLERRVAELEAENAKLKLQITNCQSH